MKISASSQDYLEALLVLSGNGGSVRSVDVAKRLNVSRASVNKAVGILKDLGLVNQERYGEIELTPEGKKAARAVHEKHNTLKYFLKEVLGVSEENAEIDACGMEHVISIETLEKLQDYLQKLNSQAN